jgi:hypothetical protein
LRTFTPSAAMHIYTNCIPLIASKLRQSLLTVRNAPRSP